METQKIKSFSIIGISLRTTNENDQSGHDIPKLWGKFKSEGILEKIPGKIDPTVYCIYTEYEKDHTKPYTVILGCKVNSLNSLPEGMVGKKLADGKYIMYRAKGNILQGMVFSEWTKIWNSNIPRVFTSDFEVYGEKAQNPNEAEVDIFVAVG